jgi:hypothetical protein
VIEGFGKSTRKYDGTCVRLAKDGTWWARREVKAGKPAPANYVPVQLDDVTGKMVGWEPIEQSAFAKFHAEAAGNGWANPGPPFKPGTYELIGPKINGNPEGAEFHVLVPHAVALELPDAPRTFDELAKYLGGEFPYEGIVWHNSDGRMAKLKRRDLL